MKYLILKVIGVFIFFISSIFGGINSTTLVASNNSLDFFENMTSLLFFNSRNKSVVSENYKQELNSANQRKSISSPGSVIIFSDPDNLVDPVSAEQIIARNIEMPRFDINQLDLQVNEAVLEELYTTKNISEKSIAQIIQTHYLGQIKSILENPEIQKQRISQFKEETYTFEFSKGRSYSVTAADLKALFNSSFFYVPYIQSVNLTKKIIKKKVDEDNYIKLTKLDIKISGGLLWYQLKINSNKSASVELIAHLKSELDNSDTLKPYLINSNLINNMVVNLINNMGSYFAFETKNLSPFKLQGRVIAAEKNKYKFKFSKLIPVFLNDHYWLMENYVTESKVGSRAVGLAYIKSKTLNSDYVIDASAIQVYGKNNKLVSWVKEAPYFGMSAQFGLANSTQINIDPRDGATMFGDIFTNTITSSLGVDLDLSFDISRYIDSTMSFLDISIGASLPSELDYYNSSSPSAYFINYYARFRKVYWIKQIALSPFFGIGEQSFNIIESDSNKFIMKNMAINFGCFIEKRIKPFVGLNLKYQIGKALGDASITNSINTIDEVSKNAEFSDLSNTSISLGLTFYK
tara:strand:- start:482 stop:2212 length:1731 start_codon:yes stop_codon:yes gene_type:complete